MLLLTCHMPFLLVRRTTFMVSASRVALFPIVSAAWMSFCLALSRGRMQAKTYIGTEFTDVQGSFDSEI